LHRSDLSGCLQWQPKANRVTDTMVKAAAQELVRHLRTQKNKQASLLPPLSQARDLGRSIAQAVGQQAIQDGQAQVADEDELNRELQANIWEPVYVPYKRQEQVFRQSV
jgi:malate dehydrogenase (oxaloacetate-decarboxylating)